MILYVPVRSQQYADHEERGLKQPVLATTPIAIYAIGLLVSWWWAPSIFPRAGYPAPHLVALALLAIGATRGLLRSFPVWSVT